MSAETWAAIAVVITAILAGYTIYTQWKNGGVFNLGTLTATVESKIPFANELSEVAQIVVNEIEQGVREGVVLSNEEKFNHALDLVKGWSPEFAELDNKKVIAAIKSAVLVASALTHQINAAKVQTLEGERKGIDVK